MNYAKVPTRCEQLSFEPRDRLPCPADLLIEALGGRGYNSIAFRAAIEPKRVSIVNRKSTTQATIAKRSGQAMVEFAIISFVLTAMLMGFLGLIVMGLGSFQNNIAAESAGRLLDQNEALPSTLVGTDDTPAERARKVYDALVDNDLYDETKLILPSAQYFDADFRATLPEINRLLLGSYIFDRDFEEYRYPGAVVTGPSGIRTVLVPLLPDGVAKGIDRAFNVDSNSVPVSDDWVGPVCVASTGNTNIYRLVVFYPSQPSSMINFEVVRDADGRIISQTPIVADDDAVGLSALPTDYNLIPSLSVNKDYAAPYRGQYGLGESFAFNASVRPFRVVFESSTIFRLVEPEGVPDP